MENQFVPYELAVKLKELGFDYICLTKWGCSSYRLYDDYKICSNKDDIVISGDFVSAPLYQQAFDFIRNDYNTIVNFHYNDKRWFGESRRVDFYERFLDAGYSKPYKTYEEARKSCLEKLIQIAQGD